MKVPTGLRANPSRSSRHGDVRAHGRAAQPGVETDANGVRKSGTRYEPYGTVYGSSAAPAQGPGYTGHVRDVDTGLSYMQQRYYDPLAGRFLSVDPIEANAASFNRYWYANNNPYGNIDPDGRSPVAVAAACAASTACEVAVAAGAAAVAKVAIDNGGSLLSANAVTGSLAFGLRLYNEVAKSDAIDPNGPTTKETKERGASGADGATSEITRERDSTGRAISTTHTVTKSGEVVHQHQDHYGENGSRRRFADDLTGTKTIGEGKQVPAPEDSGPKFPREPVQGGSRY